MLVDGQGNFGSVDGDNAAAMRYTEIRLAKIAHEMRPTSTRRRSTSAPTTTVGEGAAGAADAAAQPAGQRLGGIAVGMATNIPPHNLNEVVDACLHLLKNPQASIDELMEIIPAPDFPTAGIIYGLNGVREGYRTGRGRW